MNAEHEHIRELMEAFRPGHDDLSSPEFRLLARRLQSDERLREQFERSQQVDLAIATAIQDVAVPPELADRLLDRLSAESFTEGPVSEGPVTEVQSGEGHRLQVRGRWAPWGASAAAVSCVAAAIWLLVFMMQPDVWTLGQVAQSAFRWTRADSRLEVWHNLNAKIQADFPPRLPSRAQVALRKWQRAVDSKAVCYQLRTADGRGAAYLVVLPGRGIKSFPTTPKLTDMTAGWCVAVWAEKGHLYALVIEGSERRYRQLFPRSPTA